MRIIHFNVKNENYDELLNIVVPTKSVEGNLLFKNLMKSIHENAEDLEMDVIVSAVESSGPEFSFAKSVNKGAESLPTAEDVVFDYEIRKKGGKILFDPELGMPHKRRNSLKGLWKQIYRYGLGRAIANKKYKELKSIFHILPSLAILFFPIFLIFSIIFWILFSPIFIYLLLAFILSYFLLCVYGSATSHSKYKNARRIIKSAFLIPVAHIAWGLGYLKGMR
ncbi:MAG: hypothetical protein H5T44_05345 [Thermoplasmatales archaeon]|nr:hypothetical protein [Thermoplasmatales archaeon]